jgi:hypothetical protein
METCQRGDRNATVAVAVESIKPLLGNDPPLYETRKITPHAYFSEPPARWRLRPQISATEHGSLRSFPTGEQRGDGRISNWSNCIRAPTTRDVELGESQAGLKPMTEDALAADMTSFIQQAPRAELSVFLLERKKGHAAIFFSSPHCSRLP